MSWKSAYLGSHPGKRTCKAYKNNTEMISALQYLQDISS